MFLDIENDRKEARTANIKQKKQKSLTLAKIELSKAKRAFDYSVFSDSDDCKWIRKDFFDSIA
jgi:hypothetical protein